MFNAIDATGIDRGPLLNNQIQVALFFIFFVIIFTFFFLNIFVALIILTFQEQGEAEEGECELERNQVKHCSFSIFIIFTRYPYRIVEMTALQGALSNLTLLQYKTVKKLVEIITGMSTI